MSDDYREDHDYCSSPIADRGTNDEGTEIKSIEIPIPEDFESWTPCKKESWNQMKANPNAFFYRHVLPGEQKKNGPWSKEEKELFFKAVSETNGDISHWGLFARNIPGRVGYQCNAFYKKILPTGELQEKFPNIKFPQILKTNDDTNSKPIVEKKTKKVEIIENEFVYNNEILALDYPPENENNLFSIPNISSNNFRDKLKSVFSNNVNFELYVLKTKPFYY